MATPSILFSIVCQQPYFTGARCRVLTLAPSAACRALMQQYGLRFLPATGGGTMYYTDAARVATFASGQPLDFIISNADPDLVNYSAIDQSSIGPATQFYADNLHDGGGQMLPAFADSAVAVRLPVCQVTLAAPVSSASLVLRDSLQQVAWQGVSPALALSRIDLALQGVPAGRYTLQVDGLGLPAFYLQPQAAPRRFGTLAIFPGGPVQAPLMPAGCAAIGADGSVSAAQYTFTLAARSTVWRYHLFSSTTHLGNWQVLASAAPGASAPAAPVFTCSNPDAQQPPWTFESQQVLALAAAPSLWNIALARPPAHARHRRSSGPRIRLPYASGASLVQPAADPLGGFSDIYVYLPPC